MATYPNLTGMNVSPNPLSDLRRQLDGISFTMRTLQQRGADAAPKGIEGLQNAGVSIAAMLESLEQWCQQIELRLRALEARQSPPSAP